jgi:uncharacterized membrane protein
MNPLAALSLVIGITFCIVSLVARFFPPRSFDSRYGYRSKLSMRTDETWKEAHLYSSRLLVVASIPMLIMALVFSRRPDFQAYHLAIIIVVMFLLVIGIIFLTERRLRNKFDENGKRK